MIAILLIIIIICLVVLIATNGKNTAYIAQKIDEVRCGVVDAESELEKVVKNTRRIPLDNEEDSPPEEGNRELTCDKCGNTFHLKASGIHTLCYQIGCGGKLHDLGGRG